MPEKANNDTPIKVIKVNNMKTDDIPLEGSLGLLAAGYKGIMLWRNRVKDHHLDMLKNKGGYNRGQ